jgi:membrane protein implicated in regulation of membrane protease activity
VEVTTAQAIFLVALLFMAVSLMTLAYMYKKHFLAFGAAMGWILVAVYAYSLSVAAWDVYYGLFWFAIALVVGSVLEAMVVRERPEPTEEEEKSALDRYLERNKSQMEKLERWGNALESERKPKRRPSTRIED